MRIAERIEGFLENPDNGIWFQGICEQGAASLGAQAWQVAAVLQCDDTEAYYAMRELAHDLFPETPGGRENPKDEIMKRALDHLSGHTYVPFDVEEDIAASYEDDTLEEFREVVRGWVRELSEAGAA